MSRPRKRWRYRILAAILGLILGTWAASCYDSARWASVLESESTTTP
ncbi:hypothetical protein Pan265_21530 [Mucisphaera calidilacus]|uniref:Uncharacterized protein n=1 Tax=Mucisphaera calidilacus TaxID=2527982 RepID=A0A518BZ94_9BACT|nr:hypothetical protein Pan265_21530 [Mucisphaera calidilacus]